MQESIFKHENPSPVIRYETSVASNVNQDLVKSHIKRIDKVEKENEDLKMEMDKIKDCQLLSCFLDLKYGRLTKLPRVDTLACKIRDEFESISDKVGSIPGGENLKIFFAELANMADKSKIKKRKHDELSIEENKSSDIKRTNPEVKIKTKRKSVEVSVNISKTDIMDEVKLNNIHIVDAKQRFNLHCNGIYIVGIDEGKNFDDDIKYFDVNELKDIKYQVLCDNYILFIEFLLDKEKVYLWINLGESSKLKKSIKKSEKGVCTFSDKFILYNSGEWALAEKRYKSIISELKIAIIGNQKSVELFNTKVVSILNKIL